MPLDRFHPLVADWFRGRFGAPTEVQKRGWEAIAAGRHALLSAPTGSGKTLAAFLTCIDTLVRKALAGELQDHAEVVYVSPLKALSNDIRKNLEEPLAEIAAIASAAGYDLPPIRCATRTGDTKPRERQALAKRPPHIWVTTPESLYILLTSESGRRGLSGARTLIVDEIHAIADDKRGSHLSLSLERLEHLAGRPLTRVGLSATVSPIEEMARLLVGAASVDGDGTPRCTIVDEGRSRPLDLGLELPADELGPIASNEMWRDILDRIAELSRAHRTTLVFVNTRRLAERTSHLLAERLGADAVASHHGSLAQHIRLRSEERLRAAEVRVCVATASLELGIDIGSVDLVCQIGSPRSVAVGLQRVGRSGHAVGKTPVGRFFPLTRDELVECTALLGLMRRGELDAIEVPPWPLDILAQQMIAACSSEPWQEDELFALVRRAWPYRELPRARFDQVVEMLATGYDRSRGRRSAMLLRDGVHGEVRGRRGARLAALTSGGAIPDNADYDVVAEPEGIRVGSINEDFAIESSIGDVFLLGNRSWRVLRVERSKVRVADAEGASPTVPFWLGEAPARTPELSAAVGQLRARIERRLDDRDGLRADLMADPGLAGDAADQLIAYMEEGRRVLGLVPTGERIVAERFFDESGGMQLILHAPFGGRINRAWGLALRKRFCRSFDFELQAAATDDGINLSLGPQHSFPLTDVFRFLNSKSIDRVLTQAVLPTPIFTTRWRWNGGRALALLRFTGGRRVPPPLQRMRADDLLAAVFPAQAACQDNAPPGDIELPDHPLVIETMRDCLHEALDVAGLAELLRRIESDRIAIVARDTPQPSVFAHELLNAMPYAFLDDAPLEERRARAVTLRRALPEDQRDLGRLAPEAIAAAAEDAFPRPRDRHELHDALMALVVVAEAELSRFPSAATAWLEELVGEGRAIRLGHHLAAGENAELARRALAGSAEAAVTVVRGRAATSGPFTSAELASLLALDQRTVETACLALEGEGLILRGSFASAAAEWCDRRILARIHRATIRTLRREIEPIEKAVYLHFLTRWHGLGRARRGAAAMLAAIETLQGWETGARAWEAHLLPARVGGGSDSLDRLCLTGEVVWGRFSARAAARPTGDAHTALTRAAPITVALRDSLAWLLEPAPAEGAALPPEARAVRDHLAARGASFADDIGRAASLDRRALDDAIGLLVAAGLVSADGFAPVRNLSRRSRRGPRSHFRRRPTGTVATGTGRWWLLDRPETASDDAVEAWAGQLLRRYGVVFRDILARESAAPSWRELLGVLRRAELRGEIRGGRFIAGTTGEQFALPEAIEELRALRRDERAAQEAPRLVTISAADPLNLAGILTPGARIPAIADNRIVLRAGVPVAWSDRDGSVEVRVEEGADEARAALAEAR